MSNIVPLRGMPARRGITRQVGRALDHLSGQTEIDLARVDARAEVQAAQVDAMTAVTQRGLQGAAYITNVEMVLAEATPAAMTRLKVIGDIGSMSLANIVMDTASNLRRV